MCRSTGCRVSNFTTCVENPAITSNTAKSVCVQLYTLSLRRYNGQDFHYDSLHTFDVDHLTFMKNIPQQVYIVHSVHYDRVGAQFLIIIKKKHIFFNIFLTVHLRTILIGNQLDSGDRIPVGARFSASVQTGPGAQPASCTMGTGSFPGVKSGRGVTLTPHPFWCCGHERVEVYLYSSYGPYSLYRASVFVQACT
jgi:hypothetical protein